MNVTARHIIRFFILLFVQVFMLNSIPPLHQFIVPYLYYAYLLWLPYRIGRAPLMLLGFLLGVTADIFFKTPGLHAAVCVMVAYLRPFVIRLLMPKESTEWGQEEPNRKTMGATTYVTYLVILTLLHHTVLILLEWLQFGSFFYFVGKLFATSLVSLLLMTIADLLLSRNTRNR